MLENDYRESLDMIGVTDEDIKQIMFTLGDGIPFPDNVSIVPIFSKIHGIGLMSTKSIRVGEEVCPVFNEYGERYPPARYTNHSSNPNCVVDGKIFVATRNIAAGDELTVDYGDNFKRVSKLQGGTSCQDYG